MGAVYQATDATLEREIALKSLKPAASASSTAVARFEREARALAQLEHPNIVPIHQLGRDENDRPYYTMKLVKGRTLKAILRAVRANDEETTASFPLDRLLTIFRKTCDAIAFAHHRGVLHRDLKPENVMVGEFGEALVMDWGLAKFLDEREESSCPSPEASSPSEAFPATNDHPGSSSTSALHPDLTMDGDVFGTPNYMAPEQASGETEKIDKRTDIFALGAILYEILTLHPPVSGSSSLETLKLVIEGDIITPTERLKAAGADENSSARRPERSAPHCPGGRIPEVLSSVTMRALATRREDRYQTVRELAADIDAWRAGFSTSVENIGFIGQLRLLIRRNKAITATIAIALSALAWGGSLYVLGINAEKQVAQEERIRAQGAEQAATAEAIRANSAEFAALTAHAQTRQEFSKAQIALAEKALENRDLAGMIRLLESCPEEHRNTDWHYLHDKIDEADFILPSNSPIMQGLVACAGTSPTFIGCAQERLYFIEPEKNSAVPLDILQEDTRPDFRTLTASADGVRAADAARR